MATNPSSSETIISLKLLVDKSSNKVVFAETGKEFVDFLFGLLQVPLGSIIALLRDNDLAPGSGSLGTVHESVQNLDPSCLLPNQTKESLLNPKPAFQSSTRTPPFLQNFFSPDQQSRTDSYCRSYGGQDNTEPGYVRGVVTYMVMDDLTVKPMSTISSITRLNTLKIKDLGSVQEKKVEIDIKKCHETSPLDVLPVTAEATSNRSIVLRKADGKGLQLFQTSSPISVLESSSSCSVENPPIVEPKIISTVKRARSKRSRPRQPNFNWQFMIPFFTSSPKISHPSASFESGSETDLIETVSNPSKRKLRKKKNLTVLSGATEMMDYSSQGPVATRKCKHCEVTKTPQWREGPMGPKTLCNACGVRFRSGRLFPEYRPMASPTFVPLVHSNSHKKVIEMRSKASLVAENF